MKLRQSVSVAVILTVLLVSMVAGAQQVVTFQYMGDSQEAAIYKQVIDQFNSMQSAIFVEGDHIGGDYFDKLTTQLAGGVAPDVFHVFTEDFMRPFQQAGFLLNLSPYIERDASFDLDDFPPNLLQAAYYNDQLYALPRDVAVRVMFYNKDLLDKNGLAYPSADWTWEDLRSDATVLTTEHPDGSTKTLGIDYGTWWGPWMTMVWSWGGEWTDPEVTRVTLDSPEAITALNFMVDAIEEGWMAGPTFDWKEGFGFQHSAIGYKWDGHWIVPWAREAFNFEWDLALTPKGPAGRATTLGSNWYGINAFSKHPEAALEFVKYLVGDGNRLFTALGGAVPSRYSLIQSEDFLDSRHATENKMVWLESLATGRWAPLTVHWEQFANGLVGPELDKAFKGEQSVESAVAKIVDVAPSILNQ